jgi:hypothetical protein
MPQSAHTYDMALSVCISWHKLPYIFMFIVDNGALWDGHHLNDIWFIVIIIIIIKNANASLITYFNYDIVYVH